MVSLGMGSIVIATSEAEHPTSNEAARATDVAGNVPCEPTDAHALLPAATTTDADEHLSTIWRAGAHAEENCAAAEEAGLPSASTASATWFGRIGEYAAALRFPLWLGRPVVEHAGERGVESSAAGRRELAPCDAEGDNRADYCAGLGKARGCE